MLKLVSVIGRAVTWLILSFILVVVALAITAGLPERIGRATAEAANLRRVATELSARTGDFERKARERVAEGDREIGDLQAAGSAELKKTEREIIARRAEAQLRVLDRTGVAWALAGGSSSKIVASYLAQYVELPLADRALSLIRLRRENLEKIADRKRQVGSLNGRIATYNTHAERLKSAKEPRNNLRQEAGNELRDPACRLIAVPAVCGKLLAVRRLDEAIARVEPLLIAERKRLAAEKGGLRALQLARENVADSATIVAQATKSFGSEAKALTEESSGRAANVVQTALRRYGWWAAGIVLSAVMLPFLYKLFAFRVIAPLAGRARPVRILAPSAAARAREADFASDRALPISQTAIDVPLSRETELLVRSGVQSAASDISAGDILILKKRMPLTCLAAGLVNMQRLRSERTDYATLTTLDNDHYEVAIINVPAGGAVVLQPRALVGVLKRRSDTLRVSRPWRLRYLISWITLQLRYVVFHGPCSLIVQGHRGVRVDEAARGRMINKRLTLGFDAGLLYGAARTASFLPYLRGQESLFNDRFTGDGRYFYEQKPAHGAKSAFWGRGLKGLGDAALGVVGI